LPLLGPTAVSVAILTFAASVRDISHAVLLYSPASRPLSILMLEYSFEAQLERAAVVGILLSSMTAVIAVAVRKFGLHSRGDR
jgi:ABC-type Fe3+ transport system permease subunit